MSHREQLSPLMHVRTEALDLAYYETGPADGPAVMLLHGYPYDIHSYTEVAPRLAGAGYRVVLPHLRGHGPTHRLGCAPGAPGYDALERYLAGKPSIEVPTVTLEGEADGNFPVSEGLPDAERFTGPRLHRRVRDAGHNLPREAPDAFVRAVLDVAELRTG